MPLNTFHGLGTPPLLYRYPIHVASSASVGIENHRAVVGPEDGVGVGSSTRKIRVCGFPRKNWGFGESGYVDPIAEARRLWRPAGGCVVLTRVVLTHPASLAAWQPAPCQIGSLPPARLAAACQLGTLPAWHPASLAPCQLGSFGDTRARWR